jgi:hypothetical protein
MAVYQSTTSSGDLHGTCVSHFIANKGDKGDTGTPGTSADFTSVTAAATGVAYGTSASASVTTGGTSTAKTLAFTFNIPAGQPGTNGTNGTNGADGYTYIPSISSGYYYFTRTVGTTSETVNSGYGFTAEAIDNTIVSTNTTNPVTGAAVAAIFSYNSTTSTLTISF